MKQIAEKLKQMQEKLKQTDQKKINLTDEDAQFQRGKGGRIIPGYRAQVAVDSKNQIIVANDVTNDPYDTSQLIPMADQVCKNVKEVKGETAGPKEKIKVIADSGYHSELNLAELENRKNIDAYIPDMKQQAKERGHKSTEDSPFHMTKFVFKGEENCFICPAGKKLDYLRQTRYRRRSISIYTGKECSNCQYFGKCTTDQNGRSIWLSEYVYLVKKMREKLSTPEGKRIYGVRKITAEPVLGNISQNLGFREFLLRGIPKVKCEFSLMCTAVNLLKIARFVRGLGKSLKKAVSMSHPLPVPDTS
jgi:transposase